MAAPRPARPQSAPAARCRGQRPAATWWGGRQDPEEAWQDCSAALGEEPDVDEMLEQVKLYIFQRRVRIKDFFKDFDKLNRGRCTRWQFARALSAAVPVIGQAEVVALADHFTEDSLQFAKPQIVTYTKFIQAVNDVFNPGAAQELEKHPESKVARPGFALEQLHFKPRQLVPAEDEEMVQDVLSRMAILVEKRSIRFGYCFQDCDRRNGVRTMVNTRFSGKITAEQFCSRFPLTGEFSQAEVQLLMRRYWTDSGHVHFVSMDKDLVSIASMAKAWSEARGWQPESTIPSECSTPAASRQGGTATPQSVADSRYAAFQRPQIMLPQRPQSAPRLRQQAAAPQAAGWHQAYAQHPTADQRHQEPEEEITALPSDRPPGHETPLAIPRQVPISMQPSSSQRQRPASAGSMRSFWPSQATALPVEKPSLLEEEPTPPLDGSVFAESTAVGDAADRSHGMIAGPQPIQDVTALQEIKAQTPVLAQAVAARPSRASRPQSAPAAGRQRQPQQQQLQLLPAQRRFQGRPQSASLMGRSFSSASVPEQRPDAVAEKALDALAAFLTERRVRLHDRFRDFDRLRKGVCLSTQLKSVFTIGGIGSRGMLDVADVDALITKYATESVGGDVLVNYKALFADVERRQQVLQAQAFRPHETLADGLVMPDDTPEAAEAKAENALSVDSQRLPDDTVSQAKFAGYAAAAAAVNDVAYTAVAKTAAANAGVRVVIEDPNAELGEVMEMIRKRVRLRRFSLRTIFKDLGRQKTSHCPKEKFLRVMDNAGFRLRPKQLEVLCQAYCDKDQGRSFNYLKFCADIEIPVTAQDKWEVVAVKQFQGPYVPTEKQSQYFDITGAVVPMRGQSCSRLTTLSSRPGSAASAAAHRPMMRSVSSGSTRRSSKNRGAVFRH
eukprot:TRINITY_DN48581_c0_g1_i1.p1 TRINITY_DN48581_c0_g1~~TRINITY_DN48581_c0_g1_i1.p1  ORF type:complete len:897 (-),score=209.56 TRINITY_DN48581_c0_g1_i1:173-2863(-)